MYEFEQERFNEKMNSGDNNKFSKIHSTTGKMGSDDHIEIHSKSLRIFDKNHSFQSYLMSYLNKFKGQQGKKSPDRPPPHEMIASGVFGFVGMLLVSVVSCWYLSKEFVTENRTAVIMLAGSYCATAGTFVFDSLIQFCCSIHLHSPALRQPLFTPDPTPQCVRLLRGVVLPGGGHTHRV
jgi:hypothetical protein